MLSTHQPCRSVLSRLARVVVFSTWLSSPVMAQQPATGTETFRRHVVVAQEANAADVGREVLRHGGNAIDAAVATAFALAVTHPAAGNLGGGGFIVTFDASRKQVRTFDFRETAPRAAGPGMYLGPDGKPIPGHRAGARAAGVPGTVRGLAAAHTALGKLPWADLVRPAARLAREGFVVSDPFARSLNAQLRPRRAAPTGRNPRSSPPTADGRAYAGTTSGPTSTDWPSFPSRLRRSASPTALPGAPATGSSNPTWPTLWNGSPATARTSSTRGRRPT